MTLIRLVSVRLILWFFILILLPLPFIVLLLTELSMQFSSTLFGIIAGLVGYIWMLLSMYLSTRPHCFNMGDEPQTDLIMVKTI